MEMARLAVLPPDSNSDPAFPEQYFKDPRLRGFLDMLRHRELRATGPTAIIPRPARLCQGSSNKAIVGLLLVNHQVNDEVLHFIYSKNTFAFSDPLTLGILLRQTRRDCFE